MSGQVAQLDPGSYSGGSPPSKIGAQALGGLGGPLICEKPVAQGQYVVSDTRCPALFDGD